MQSNTHFKVQFGNELRRFALRPSFDELLSTICALFSIGDPLTIKYCDDEGDWVSVSSDIELQHAVELGEVPLRLLVEVAKSLNTPNRGGKGGRGGRKFNSFTPEERLDIKSDRLAKRIENLERKLENGEIPNGKARTLVWRLEKIQKKLEFVEQQKQDIQNGLCPQQCGGRGRGRGGRGRGGRGRGGRGGRGFGGPKWRNEFSETSSVDDTTSDTTTTTSGDITTSTSDDVTTSSKSEETPKNLNLQIRMCRQKLNAAKKSGNEAEIKICEQALTEVLEAKKAKQEMNKLVNEALKEHRVHLQQCKTELRNARQNGASKDEIQSKVSAVQDAKKQLQEARKAQV